MSSSTSRILVVGGGITSAITTANIVDKISKAQVSVWDKSRGAGGRMATSRSSANPQCKLDLGAQYISCAPENQVANKDIYEELIGAGLLSSLDPKDIQGFRHGDDGTLHYFTPQGMSSLVKHFFNRSGVKVDFGRRVSDISLSDSELLITSEDGIKECFDGIVLTLPIPQLLELKGDIATIIQSNQTVLQNLQSVQYSTRFALGLFYDKPIDLGVTWSAKYISGHDIYRYVAIDNKKRGDENGPTSVVAHTSVPFGIKNIEATPDSMKDMLVKSLLELFPTWPHPASIKCLKWKFSQVSKSYPGNEGHLILNQNPLIVLAGDAFTKSGLDGCAISAKAAAHAVNNNFPVQ
eukprot:TRINITY_DN40832_c0_g1_i1.p1 TRINITY_DN40832_c0_g1~~TRINITY_DN40832_c0_g1_i1.p1  ORF type:complete len:351 (-),score=56.69 TRINITY_DN40832_c0_g1_i1:451-1503(-)